MAAVAVAAATTTTAVPVLAGKPETVDDASSVPGYQADIEYSDAEAKRVRRQFDLRVLPVCMLLFIFMQLDRGSVANALTDNLVRDIGATLDTINLAQTFFTLGFVVMELPMSFLAKRYGPHRALPIWCLGWGVSVMGQGFVQSGRQLVATRFLIGFFEAGFITAFYLGRFYRTRELAVRYAFLWQSNSLASIISAALATGILNLRGQQGHPGWRYLFWIEGAMTIAVALLALVLLPRGPAYTRGGVRGKGFFTEREVAIAVTRVIRDDPSKVNETHSRRISRADVRQTFSNPRLYLLLDSAHQKRRRLQQGIHRQRRRYPRLRHAVHPCRVGRVLLGSLRRARLPRRVRRAVDRGWLALGRPSAGQRLALRPLRRHPLHASRRGLDDHLARRGLALQLGPLESASARAGRSAHECQCNWLLPDAHFPGVGRAPLPMAATHVRGHLAVIAIVLKLSYMRWPSRQERAQAADAPVAASVAESDDGSKTPVDEKSGV